MNLCHCRKRHSTNLCQLLDEMFAENAFTENVFESKMIRKKELKNLHTTSERCPSLRRFVYLLATYSHCGWFIAIGYQISSRGRSLAVHSVLDCGSCPLQQCRVLGQNPHSLSGGWTRLCALSQFPNAVSNEFNQPPCFYCVLGEKGKKIQ